MKNTLQLAVQQGLIRPLDRQVSLFLAQLDQTHECSDEQLLSAALVSNAVGNGHVCLPLDTIADKKVFKSISAYKTPNSETLRDLLQKWPLVGKPGANTPLILDTRNRLYLARYFNYQQTISQDLLRRSQGREEVDHLKALPLLEQLFPATEQMDWQRLAASLALFKKLVIISGGPGTGKTHTIAGIMALLNNIGPAPLKIGLAAPTGKAANRLKESICKAKAGLPDSLQASIPEDPQTLHRLLGVQPDSLDFRANKKNPLQLDLLVIDEASMVDVPMMAKLLEALPETTRLIILGDRDQLASVEAGSLFADLCGETDEFHCSPQLYKSLKQYNKHLEHKKNPPVSFADSVIRLQKSYRFSKQGSIGRLAAAVNRNNQLEIQKILSSNLPDFTFLPLSGLELTKYLSQAVLPYYQKITGCKNATAALQIFNKFRILCALRDGPYGINTINKMVAEILEARGLISITDRWYKGQPLMIGANHYGLQLFNGDTGIIWPNENQVLLAWFLRADGSMFPIAPSRLPEHETAYAVTVHKAQGSEFKQVLLILPPQEHQIVTKELIYTGITRSREKLTLLAESVALQASIRKKVVRYSGLADTLWI